MQLKRFSVSLLAAICTITVVDVRPTAAVQIPANLGVVLPGTHIVPTSFALLMVKMIQ
jgi:hypothetical protein